MSRHRIIVIRHGETDWNAEARLQGQKDIPLNQTGLEQSRRAGRSLVNLLGPAGLSAPGLKWFCSPLSRTRQTLDLVRQTANLPPGQYKCDDRLKELTFGQWEGLTWPEVQLRSPKSANWREGDKWNFVPPGGESYNMLADRVRPWLQELGSDAIVSTHGGVARVLLVETTGMDSQRAALETIWQGRLLVLEGGKWSWIG